MAFTDTGLNLPEPKATLLAQQEQLLQRKRFAQMFPLKTAELSLPDGFARIETKRGVFHFDPGSMAPETIQMLSEIERENILLGLGPYNKTDIAKRVLEGEKPLAVTERTANGVEVKAVVGTGRTAGSQKAALEKQKLDGSKIEIETLDQVLTWRRNNQWR